MNLTFKEIIKLAVNEGELPRYIYKYLPIRDDIFSKKTMKFSKSADFNDPFDCKLELNNQYQQHELEHYFEFNGLRKDIALEAAKYYTNNSNSWNVYLNNLIHDELSKCRICCFSEKNDDILMWSHYSDKHKGICLKFDLIIDPDFFDIPMKVQYEVNYPELNFIRDKGDCLKTILSTKALDWKYEKEIRIFKQNCLDYISFRKEALIEVVFGCKTESSEISRIMKIANEHDFSHLTFKKAVQKKSMFALDFESI